MAVNSLTRHLEATKGNNELLDLLYEANDSSCSTRDTFMGLVQRQEDAGTLTRWTVLESDPYRFPLLQWAAVLTRSRVLSWLLSHDYSALDRCAITERTALHSLVLYSHLARSCVRVAESAYRRVIPLLADSLGVVDSEKNTPFHLAALLLLQGGDTLFLPYHDALMNVMLTVLESKHCRTSLIVASETLSMQNLAGDTVLHILARGATVTKATVQAVVNTGLSLLLVLGSL